MAGKGEALRDRTKKFALRIIRLVRALPKTDEGRVIGRQLLRSGTSVAANYRSCHRAKSRADFAAKMATVLEEADETQLWLELLLEGGTLKKGHLGELMKETDELIRIFSASLRTARSKPEGDAKRS